VTTTVSQLPAAPPGRDAQDLDAVWLVFTVGCAVAALLHLAGNSALAPWWAKAALGAAAVGVLARPRSRAAVAVMCASVLVTVWVEAPLLGNHWLLSGLVALVVLGALSPPFTSVGVSTARMRGPLRLLLLAFYVFAAFAKLNEDFFDPAVSCGAQFLRETAASWDLAPLVDGWSRGIDVGVAVAVATIELSVPALLISRRTRRAGVLLGLAFHFVLALNRDHQFFDFSGTLVPLFLLFLPSGIAAQLLDDLRTAADALRERWPSGPQLLRLAALAVGAMLALGAAGSERFGTRWVVHDAGLIFWLLYGAGTLLLVGRVSMRGWPCGDPLVDRRLRWPLLLVPALALLNGVSPYLELKTGASWNMYSNLSVVDGTSNHLLVRSGVPLTDAHERLVEVVEADGVDLGFYDDSPWRLPEVMLLDHLADRPGATVVGTVDGEEVRYVGGRGGGRPTWQRKLQVFRAVDVDGPVSCQPSFGPAR